MTDTDLPYMFKSAQWRICSQCLVGIAPNDHVGMVDDEIACVPCKLADEDAVTAADEECDSEA